MFGTIVLMLVAAKCKDAEVCALTSKATLISGVTMLAVVLVYAAMISSFGQFGDINYYFDPVHPDTPMVNSAGIKACISMRLFVVALTCL